MDVQQCFAKPNTADGTVSFSTRIPEADKARAIYDIGAGMTPLRSFMPKLQQGVDEQGFRYSTKVRLSGVIREGASTFSALNWANLLYSMIETESI